MDITSEQWNRIRALFGNASRISASMKRSVPYCAIATVDDDGSPRVTPISSLILGENMQGFYFEEFSVNMARNLSRDRRVCFLVVNNALPYWIKALVLGRLDSPPAIRLTGTVGERREARPEEIAAFRRPIRPFKILSGYQSLWGIMKHGRDVQFHSFEPVNCGPMRQRETL